MSGEAITNVSANMGLDMKKSPHVPVNKTQAKLDEIGKNAKEQLMYLGQLMNIQVQFSDFPKANHEMFLTLVSLNTHPPQVNTNLIF